MPLCSLFVLFFRSWEDTHVKNNISSCLQSGEVTDHDISDLFTIQLEPYIFLAQNCVRLEHDFFKTQLLDYLSQISRPFTTPSCSVSCSYHARFNHSKVKCWIIWHVIYYMGATELKPSIPGCQTLVWPRASSPHCFRHGWEWGPFAFIIFSLFMSYGSLPN